MQLQIGTASFSGDTSRNHDTHEIVKRCLCFLLDSIEQRICLLLKTKATMDMVINARLFHLHPGRVFTNRRMRRTLRIYEFASSKFGAREGGELDY